MARGAVQSLRQSDRSWKAVGVWHGTPVALAARFLPGVLVPFVTTVLEQARPPIPDGKRVRGTWEDWIGYALDALSNGQDLWIEEVPPDQMEPTADLLFARHVLGLTGAALKAYQPQGITSMTTGPLPDLEGRSARA